jgi:NAD-dependent dihydropyrimidine dehydrogenase PreA subunit
MKKNNYGKVVCFEPQMPVSSPVIIDSEKCTGCNRCIEICQVDVFIPGTKKGDPPVILFPGECWYCGCCVMECPVPDTISLRHPLMNQVRWIAKDKLG